MKLTFYANVPPVSVPGYAADACCAVRTIQRYSGEHSYL